MLLPAAVFAKATSSVVGLALPLPEPQVLTAAQAAVATMPGAFGKGTTAALLEWVRDHGYENGENFQKYVAEKMNAAE